MRSVISNNAVTDYMQNSNDYLFVYGSLRKSVGHTNHQLLEHHAEYIGDAVFRGRLYMVNTFPGAVRSDNPKDRVKGEVYRLAAPGMIFNNLDKYEGYDAKNREESLFVRSTETVRLSKNGKKMNSWIYLYNRSVHPLQRILSGDYLDHIDIEKPN